jgi:FkbM family methyltransferase
LELSLKVYEPQEVIYLESIVNSGNTVLDIGANIGYYSLILARKVGENGRVYAFEPEPENFELLKKNVAINHYQNIIPVNMAISDTNGISRLYINETNKGDHRLYDSGNKRSFITVEKIKLDDYFKGQPQTNIDVIKMDIQGSELQALKGMTNLLLNSKKLILVLEFWPFGLNCAGSNPEELIDFLTEMGFHIFVLDEIKKCNYLVTKNELLNGLSKLNECDSINLICIKGN